MMKFLVNRIRIDKDIKRYKKEILKTLIFKKKYYKRKTT